MLRRLRDERGMGLIELVAATVVITIALLALMAGYDAAFTSMHKAARTSSAAQLAETQLELYGSLYDISTADPVAQIGLSSSLLTTAKASDTYYSTDESALSPSGTDVTYASCTTTAVQCMPVQTGVKGSDGKSYRIETFIRDVNQTIQCATTNTPASCTCSGTPSVCTMTTPEREVTVIVRDPNTSGTPTIYTVSAAFDEACKRLSGGCS